MSDPLKAAPGVAPTDDALELWRVREGMRQGELRLAGQTAALTVMRNSATTILGWGVTISLALVAAFVNHQFQLVAAVGLCATNLAAACCLFVLWPRIVPICGDPDWLLASADLDSEHAVLLVEVNRYRDAIAAQERVITWCARALCGAWISFASAPAITFLSFLIRRAL